MIKIIIRFHFFLLNFNKYFNLHDLIFLNTSMIFPKFNKLSLFLDLNFKIIKKYNLI